MRASIAFLLLLLLQGAAPALAQAPTGASSPGADKALRVCANQALGRPEDGASPYVLMQAVQRQLPQLRLDYTTLPWSRCLQEAAAGHFDAVLAASHNFERAQGLRYPGPDGAPPDERLRMYRIGYVLLKRKAAALRWDGQAFSGSAAQPGKAVGAERGYSIVQFARDHGAVVEDRYPQMSSLLDSLKLGRVAGVLLNQEYAAQLLSEPEWAAGYELSGPPLETKAYYLPVSRAYFAREPEFTAQLWRAIEKARKQPAFQRQFSLAMSGGRRRDIQP